MSIIEKGTRKVLFSTLLFILFCPLSMIFIGILCRNQCPGQPNLSNYHIIFGSVWIFLFLLNLIRYNIISRYLDIISIIIWLLLLLFIIPGYVYLYSLRRIIRISSIYPNELCQKGFYMYSSISIILVHIPLYIYLWISWSLTHSKDYFHDRPRTIKVFTITPI